MNKKLLACGILAVFVCWVKTGGMCEELLSRQFESGQIVSIRAAVSDYVPSERQIKEMKQINEMDEVGREMKLPVKTHTFEFIVKTNNHDPGFVAWRTASVSFKTNEMRDQVYKVLDVFLDAKYLIILAQDNWFNDTCNVIELESLQGLDVRGFELIRKNNQPQDSISELRKMSHLSGPSHIRKTSDGFYEVVSEWRRDVGERAYDPAQRIMSWKANWETNNLVFRFNGQSWDLLTTNLWTNPKRDE